MHKSSLKIRDFPNWQNRILKQHYGEDNNALFFAKALSYILLTCAITMLVFNFYFLAAGPEFFSATAKVIFIPVHLTPVIAFAAAYRILLLGQYAKARNIFAAITILAIVFSIGMTGGFFNSIASPFLVVVPVMVFLLYGMRAGTLIALAVPFFVIIQTASMAALGLKFPDYTSYANTDMNTITTNLALYLLVIAMVASYEFHRNNLRKEIQAEREKLADLANRDPLTGLSNSRHFYTELETCHTPGIENSRLAIMYLDLNNFKQINDNFGHQIGDRVLVDIAAKIEICAGPDDIVARMGGDEFVILMRGDIGQAQLDKIRSNLQDAICRPIQHHDIVHKVGVSIGQCIYPDDTSDINAMLQIADRKMYEDKNRQFAERVRSEVNAMPHLGDAKSA